LITCINGGTEGWKGETRVMTPHRTPCFECLVHLFPKDPYNFPMCTTADKPRSPEHCIVFSMEKRWPEKFGEDKKIDGDDESHINMIMDWAKEHAQKFNLDDKAVTYNLTKGVVKRIIPAIASTNACVSAACANEAFKIVTRIYHALENFTNFSGNDGCFSMPTNNELNPACLVCGNTTLDVKFPGEKSLNDFVHYIKTDKGLFQFYNTPTLMWDDTDEDEEDHDFMYIYSQNLKMCDQTLLPLPMNQTFKQGSEMYLSQPQNKVNEKGQTFIESIKQNKLRLIWQPLSEWLKEHTEFIDDWGSWRREWGSWRFFIRTPLSRAAEKGDQGVVELLLKNGARPDFEDENGCTPLSRAIETGNAAVVELLLAQGAKVDYQYKIELFFGRRIRTPLSRAAEIGDKIVVELLLKNGAQPGLKDVDGRTPLSRTRNAAVVRLLNHALGVKR